MATPKECDELTKVLVKALIANIELDFDDAMWVLYSAQFEGVAFSRVQTEACWTEAKELLAKQK